MRPMGFFLMTSLPSSVRWVLLPCCESSSSQTWWVSVDVLCQGWRVRKSPSGVVLHRYCLHDWLKVVPCFQGCWAAQFSTCYYLFKNKDCVCTILGHDSGFSLQNFSEGIWKDCSFTLRRMTSNWISVFVPWALWLLLEYEVHMGLIEHSLFCSLNKMTFIDCWVSLVCLAEGVVK